MQIITDNPHTKANSGYPEKKTTMDILLSVECKNHNKILKRCIEFLQLMTEN